MNKLERPQGVFFDLDGTLVDSIADISRAIDHVLAELDCPPAGEDRVRLWVGSGSKVLVERALYYAFKQKNADVTAAFAEAHQRFLNFYQQHLMDATCLFDGVTETLDSLLEQGIACALITNKLERFARPLLEKFALDRYFQSCLFADSLPEKKPHPMLSKHACQQLNVLSEQVLMVGDSETDVVFARASGIKVVSCAWGYFDRNDLAELKPDALIDRIADLNGLWS